MEYFAISRPKSGDAKGLFDYLQSALLIQHKFQKHSISLFSARQDAI